MINDCFMNGEYKEMFDHCLTSSSIKSFNFINFEFIHDVINLSDHIPLLIFLKWDMFINRIEQSNNMLNCDKIITLPPNFVIIEIKEFNNFIRNEFNNFINMQIKSMRIVVNKILLILCIAI
jgi:hypothetical protein